MIFPLRLISVFVVVAALLIGCDFRLRGNLALPNAISSLQIQAPMYLANELAILLDSNGVVLASDRNDADAILVVERETFDKRTLSIDSHTGKEREHELVYMISYRVLATDGRELLPQRTVNLVRDYVFDEDAVLATSQEESISYQEMRQDAALQILHHLAAWYP
uniref:LPS-assembly lipoprotein LptE n=1 Tax=Candidatus Kentrum sp. TUN TaxID=2126343 RepID=A0A450ZKQ3_9GAMM|nr:MAG: LPS-assembly lipoprotein [Candidatus Kentron sp. TUN]VFK56282.1 MAG: LPS-assembly lipoprotein [Candidatus Kentron sp. TUN]VFK56540.1 MAG: LPS-assembly lipoprotein [Candidatus Kentron sp. TUN]